MIKTSLRTLYAFFRASLVRDMSFRTEFCIDLCLNALWVALMFGTASILFAHNSTIAGWTPQQVALLIVSWQIIFSLGDAMIWPSLSTLATHIHQGTIDTLLIRPVPLIVQVLGSRYALKGIVQTVCYVIAATVLIVQFHIAVTVWSLFGYVVGLIMGVVLLATFLLVLESLAFWFDRVDNVKYLYFSIGELGKYPVNIYGRFAWVMYSFFPVAFFGTIQAGMLFGKTTLLENIIFCGCVAMIAFFGLAFFYYSVRKYRSAA